MAYTPELHLDQSRTLRRIAWALDIPMTKTMKEIFMWLPKILDNNIICAKCWDKTRCETCAFQGEPHAR
jgi:hypothetical protein